MTKRARVKPTKMWARFGDTYENSDNIAECRPTDSFHFWQRAFPVMVLGYRDYLALKRAAKGRKR